MSQINSRLAKSSKFPDQTMPVSKHSLWDDSEWRYGEKTDGAAHTNILTWDFEISDRYRSIDPKLADMMSSLKHLSWSLINSPEEGNPLKISTIHLHSYHWRDFIRWMVSNAFFKFSQVKSVDIWSYLNDWVLKEFEEDDSQNKVRLRSKLSAINSMWKQRPFLVRAGCDVFCEKPFDGLSASEVVRRLGGIAEQLVPPLPDEVAIPILAAAERLLSRPAEDFLELSKIIIDKSVSCANCVTFFFFCRKNIPKFEFATLENEASAWKIIDGNQIELELEGNKIHHSVPHIKIAFSRMFSDFNGAVASLVQGTTGMRISELASIPGTWTSGALYPDAIEVRISESGLNELFFVKGFVTKQRPSPEPGEWLIGVRPVGSSAIPLPVIALCFMQRLYSPWRSASDAPAVLSQRMFLRLGMGFHVGHLGDGLGVVPSNHHALLRDQRNFILRYTDLERLHDLSLRSEDLKGYRESRGTIFRSSQWRKSFAQFVWRVDSRMTPAISEHFKHMSMAVTENAYIGNDLGLLGELDSQRRQETVRLFKKWSAGERPSTGGMAKRLVAYRHELSTVTSQASPDANLSAIEDIVDRNEIKLWFSDHGACFITADPIASKCHELAGTTSWANKKPSFAFQSPGVCSGCSCYYVDDQHREYWEGRRSTNATLLKLSDLPGYEETAKILKARLKQSEAVLKAIAMPVKVA